eukprot:scaffold35756_cov58-Phaeocystis_antarctica.AAC.6
MSTPAGELHSPGHRIHVHIKDGVSDVSTYPPGARRVHVSTWGGHAPSRRSTQNAPAGWTPPRRVARPRAPRLLEYVRATFRRGRRFACNSQPNTTANRGGKQRRPPAHHPFSITPLFEAVATRGQSQHRGQSQPWATAQTSQRNDEGVSLTNQSLQRANPQLKGMPAAMHPLPCTAVPLPPPRRAPPLRHAPACTALLCSLSPVGCSAGRPHRSLTRPTPPALLLLLSHTMHDHATKTYAMLQHDDRSPQKKATLTSNIGALQHGKRSQHQKKPAAPTTINGAHLLKWLAAFSLLDCVGATTCTLPGVAGSGCGTTTTTPVDGTISTVTTVLPAGCDSDEVCCKCDGEADVCQNTTFATCNARDGVPGFPGRWDVTARDIQCPPCPISRCPEVEPTANSGCATSTALPDSCEYDKFCCPSCDGEVGGCVNLTSASCSANDGRPGAWVISSAFVACPPCLPEIYDSCPEVQPTPGSGCGTLSTAVDGTISTVLPGDCAYDEFCCTCDGEADVCQNTTSASCDAGGDVPGFPGTWAPLRQAFIECPPCLISRCPEVEPTAGSCATSTAFPDSCEYDKFCCPPCDGEVGGCVNLTSASCSANDGTPGSWAIISAFVACPPCLPEIYDSCPEVAPTPGSGCGTLSTAVDGTPSTVLPGGCAYDKFCCTCDGEADVCYNTTSASCDAGGDVPGFPGTWAPLRQAFIECPPCLTLVGTPPPPSSPPSPPSPPQAPPADAACFGRERTAACRLLDGGASAAAAHSACWGAGGSNAGSGVAAAALVPMSELVAGDLVLTEKDGAPHVDRVVVNQHREASAACSAALLALVHAAGSLTLTPNHVVWLDGGFSPARSAAVGSVLSNGLAVTAISVHAGGIVNPIVAGGTILASDKAGGGPVLAATADEWTADVLLSAYPKYSPSCALAAVFPAAAQAYYDDALEPLFNAAVPTLATLKASTPAPLAGLALVAGDVALAAGLGAYTLGLKGACTLCTLAVAALAVAALRRAARK